MSTVVDEPVWTIGDQVGKLLLGGFAFQPMQSWQRKLLLEQAEASLHKVADMRAEHRQIMADFKKRCPWIV